MPSRKRTHRARVDWIEIFRRFEASGLGASAFCRRERIPPSSFQRWRRRLGSGPRPEFVELVPASTPAETSTDWSLEVALPNGTCLRFRG
jgi:hypothetical protein